MLMAQHQQSYDLQKNAGIIKGKKTPGSSRALEIRLTALEAKPDNDSNESVFPDENPKANYRNNPALDRRGISTRQSHADI